MENKPRQLSNYPASSKSLRLSTAELARLENFVRDDPFATWAASQNQVSTTSLKTCPFINKSIHVHEIIGRPVEVLDLDMKGGKLGATLLWKVWEKITEKFDLHNTIESALAESQRSVQKQTSQGLSSHEPQADLDVKVNDFSAPPQETLLQLNAPDQPQGLMDVKVNDSTPPPQETSLQLKAPDQPQADLDVKVNDPPPRGKPLQLTLDPQTTPHTELQDFTQPSYPIHDTNKKQRAFHIPLRPLPPLLFLAATYYFRTALSTFLTRLFSSVLWYAIAGYTAYLTTWTIPRAADIILAAQGLYRRILPLQSGVAAVQTVTRTVTKTKTLTTTRSKSATLSEPLAETTCSDTFTTTITSAPTPCPDVSRASWYQDCRSVHWLCWMLGIILLIVLMEVGRRILWRMFSMDKKVKVEEADDSGIEDSKCDCV